MSNDTAPALSLFSTLPAPLPITRPAYFRQAIATRTEAVQGRRSWDAYADVFAPAYDDVLVMHDDLEPIAVVCAYVEFVLGEPPPAELQRLIGRGVRVHGKAMLLGYHEALQRVDDEDPCAMHRYALAVARRVVNQRAAQPTVEQ